jgi:hypothetical protein
MTVHGQPIGSGTSRTADHQRATNLHPIELPLVKHARREMSGALVVWAVALTYTVGVSVTMGYGRSAESLTFVLGFPDWIFWGVVVPWFTSAIVSTVYAFWVMVDDPLEPSTPLSESDSYTQADSMKSTVTVAAMPVARTADPAPPR